MVYKEVLIGQNEKSSGWLKGIGYMSYGLAATRCRLAVKPRVVFITRWPLS